MIIPKTARITLALAVLLNIVSSADAETRSRASYPPWSHMRSHSTRPLTHRDTAHRQTGPRDNELSGARAVQPDTQILRTDERGKSMLNGDHLEFSDHDVLGHQGNQPTGWRRE